MNQLVIIGNGFDLAHGLKTSYHDFILWYLNKRLKTLANSNEYTDELIDCSFSRNLIGKEKLSIVSIDDFYKYWNHWKNFVEIRVNNEYFDGLLSETIHGWVDIELFYYKELLEIYKVYSLPSRSKPVPAKLLKLNEFMRAMRSELETYLKELNKNPPSILFQSLYQRIIEPSKGNNIMIVNFNYTSTIEQYIVNFPNQPNDVIYIHGKLGNPKNPIIFGYGDDLDENYEKIEDTGEDKFLEHIKPFWYLKTNNYRKVTDFLETYDYKVNILGHSCGLSDRVLLSEIFTNKNCKKIDILYHDKGNGNNDYTERLYAISRQFPHQYKGDMRKKIIPFEESIPLARAE